MAESKICGKCGAILPDGAKFCVSCGAPIPKEEFIVCPRCSSKMEPRLFFCTQCGERLREGAAPSFLNKSEDGAQSPTDSPAAPVNYASPAAPDNLLQTPPSQQNAAALQPEAEKLATSATAAAQKKKSHTLIIALGLFVTAALTGAAVFMTGGGLIDTGTAAEHYIKAVNAMEQIGFMNWNPDMSSVPMTGDEYTDEDFYKQWLIVKEELKKAADKGTPEMKCDYVAFLVSHVLGEPDDYVPNKKEMEKYLRKAAGDGSGRAKYYLFAYDILTDGDEKSSFLMEACQNGNPYALHQIGEVFAGFGNISNALENFIQAANNLELNDPENTPFMNEMRAAGPRGDTYIQAEWPAEIGAIYELGVGGEPSRASLLEAIRWYDKSLTASSSTYTDSVFICHVSGAGDYMIFDPNDAVARVKRKMGRR